MNHILNGVNLLIS